MRDFYAWPFGVGKEPVGLRVYKHGEPDKILAEFIGEGRIVAAQAEAEIARLSGTTPPAWAVKK